MIPAPTLYLCCSSSGRVSVSHVIRKQNKKGDDGGTTKKQNQKHVLSGVFSSWDSLRNIVTKSKEMRKTSGNGARLEIGGDAINQWSTKEREDNRGKK